MILLQIICFVGVATFATAAEEKNKEVGTVVGIDLGTTYSW